MAQIAEPLAAADISAYYISTFNFDHALVSSCPSPGTPAGPEVSPGADTPSVPRQVPEEGIAEVIQLLQQRQESSR